MAATTQRGWSEGLRAKEEPVGVHYRDTEPGNGVTVTADSKRRSNRDNTRVAGDQAERGCYRIGKGRRELAGA